MDTYDVKVRKVCELLSQTPRARLPFCVQVWGIYSSVSALSTGNIFTQEDGVWMVMTWTMTCTNPVASREACQACGYFYQGWILGYLVYSQK